MILNYDLVCFLYVIGTQLGVAFSGDNDYNIVHRDGSFEFGYDTPDSYHYADGNRKNIVRGEYGGRSPKTGGIDSVVYTAGPRGFRPRGKNIVRKYDLSQSGARPIGSPNDPYYDPYEDPSYNFGFRTRTQTRTENANRVGDVTGKYSFVDDVGERHNVEYIAGKNTGFHVKTPFPDSNPRAYGPLYFRGRGRPIPRGRTSIQRGLDGSYKFVSAGPDQRRTETSDSTGHVRGSYTYLDDKGVQHSVHYIAGPETGYRVLKNVKGPHLPTVFPFGTSGIIPPDFYDDYEKDVGDVFDTAASGHVKPINNNNVDGSKPGKDKVPTFGDGVNIDKVDYDIGNERPEGGSGSRPGGGGGSRPGGGGGSRPGGAGGSRPGGGGGSRPGKPGASEDDYGDDEGDYDLFGGGKPQGSGSGRPSSGSTQRPPSDGLGGNSYIPPKEDDGSFRPGSYDSSSTARPDGADFESNEYGSSKPGSGSTTKRPVFGDAVGGKPSRPGSGEDYFPSKLKPGKPTSRPGSRPGGTSDFGEDYDFNDVGTGVFGGGSSKRPPSRPSGGFSGTFDVDQTGGSNCRNCQGTIVTNVGDRTFLVPPGVSVRAHVQAIDLQPLESKVLSPSEQFRIETNVKTEQLNEESDELVGTTIESKTTISPALDSSKEETSKSDEDNTTIATNEENS